MDQVSNQLILKPKLTYGDLSMLSDSELLKVCRQDIKSEAGYELATNNCLKIADKGDDTQNFSSSASKTVQMSLKNSKYKVEIFTLCVDASNDGSRSAAYIISECYELGFDVGYPVDRDVSQQITYMKRAAELDHPEALLQLSQRYEESIGVKQDLLESAKCLERLSYLYEHGCGVRQSTVIANQYSREATSLREKAYMEQRRASELVA